MSRLDEHVVFNFSLRKRDLHIDLVVGPVMLTRYSFRYALVADTAYWCEHFAVVDAGFATAALYQ